MWNLHIVEKIVSKKVAYKCISNKHSALKKLLAQFTYCNIFNENIQGSNLLPQLSNYIYTQTSTMMVIPYHQGRRNVSQFLQLTSMEKPNIPKPKEKRPQTRIVHQYASPIITIYMYAIHFTTQLINSTKPLTTKGQ